MEFLSGCIIGFVVGVLTIVMTLENYEDIVKMHKGKSEKEKDGVVYKVVTVDHINKEMDQYEP